jgi:hypothetical protein
VTVRAVWTEAQVRALGVRTDGVTACHIVYGVQRTKAQEMLRRGECDFRVMRVGRRYVVPVVDILRVLGLGDDRQATGGGDAA